MEGLGKKFAESLVSGNRHTEGMITVLSGLGGAMVLLILIFGGVLAWGSDGSAAAGAHFIFWGLTAAFAALLVGGGAGLLFGLPTSRRVESRGGPAEGDEARTGYVESTSLEQIADFLVKGLVALSLTSFDRWTGRFDALAARVSATLLNQPACTGARCPPVDRAPGGLLLVGFGLLGFLIAYLWMRRWFIHEMVTARKEAWTVLAVKAADEQLHLQTARAENRTGSGSSPDNNADGVRLIAQKMAEQSVAAVGDPGRESASAISAAVQNPPNSDDPWKGAFGGRTEHDGFRLSATVSPLVSDPDNFQVDLLVTAPTASRPELVGSVAHFYLHPTFGSNTVDVPIDANGRAALQIFSYGAFTVGVLIDDGTRLELDLAQLPGAPKNFVDR